MPASEKKPPLVIIGGSGHARVVIDAARRTGAWNLVGVLDAALKPNAKVGGIKVLGGDAALPKIAARHRGLCAIVAVGDNAARERIVAAIAKRMPGFPFASVVHPAAAVADRVTLGPGCFVAAGAVIGPSVRVGAHAIVNTHASVDHDVVLEDFSFIGPNAALAGAVRVGRSAFVGIGASVIQNMQVGRGAVVGAGAAVIADVPAGTTVGGVPAHPLRSQRPGG